MLIGTSSSDMRLVFSEIYSGSIFDSNLTEKSDVLTWVVEEHEIMSDQGFAIQGFCSIKGIYLNRPSQKKITHSFVKLKLQITFILLQRAFMLKGLLDVSVTGIY